MLAKKGDWVQIHQVVLRAEERVAKLPEDTLQHPVELWVKGFLISEGRINDQVTIKTLTGRETKGKLIAINPLYTYGFGEEFVPELLQIGIQLRAILKEEA